MKNSDAIAFELGWDLCSYGLDYDDTYPKPISDGIAAAKEKYKTRLPSNCHVKKWLQLRRHAFQRGIYFDTDSVTPLFLEYISVDRCPITNVIMSRATGLDTDLSIDRVCNEYGYVAGNVVAMSKRANKEKSNLNLAEIQERADNPDLARALTAIQWEAIAILCKHVQASFHGETIEMLDGKIFIEGLYYEQPCLIQCAILHFFVLEDMTYDEIMCDVKGYVADSSVTALFRMLMMHTTRKTAQKHLEKLLKHLVKYSFESGQAFEWDYWGMATPKRLFRLWWRNLLEEDKTNIADVFRHAGLYFDIKKPETTEQYRSNLNIEKDYNTVTA